MKRFWPAWMAFLMMAFAAGAQTPDEREQTFLKLEEKAQKDPGAVSAEEIKTMLQLGKELGRSYSASVAVKGFLSQHLNVPSDLMRLAAEDAQYCGDFRTAVTRYKQYLKTAAPGPDASAALASVCHVLIESLGAQEDAFLIMDEFGEKLRPGSAAVRKFDPWFINMARERRACPALARRLALAFSEQMPLEQERLYYWESLDWLMADITQARPEQFDALPHCRRLLSLIRENPSRTARFGLYVANLAFKAGAAGKEQAALDKEFEPVLACARAYFDAVPTAETLQDIIAVFLGGQGRFDESEWQRQLGQKRILFCYAFDKLSDKDRETMMAWSWGGINNRMATPDQWVELGTKYPELFRRSPATTGIGFSPVATNRSFFLKQTAFLQGVASPSAAAINAMASSEDLGACIQNLIQTQSWFLDYPDAYVAILNQMWPSYASFPRDAAHAIAGDYFGKTYLQFGSQFIAKTPLCVFSPDSARDYVVYAWRYASPDVHDKTKFLELLHSLDWVPYTDEQRKAVFTPAYDEFKRWAEEGRKAFDDAKAVQDAAAKAAEEAKKTRAETTRLQDEGKKNQEAAKKAMDAAAKALEDAKKAHADALKAQTDSQAALKAAQDAKDANRIAAADKQLQDLGKSVTDLAAKLPPLDKAFQDAAAKVAETEKTADGLTATGKQQDTGVTDLVKKWADATNATRIVGLRIASITPVEQAFKQVFDAKVADGAKPPDALCQNVASAVRSLRAKNLAGFAEAARALYPTVRDYDVKKTPFGMGLLKFLAQNRVETLDTFDLQCEFLADQMTLYSPQGANRTLREVLSYIMSGSANWSGHKAKCEKLNAVLAKGLSDLLAKNQFWPELFDALRATRQTNKGLNLDLLAKMIDQKTLLSSSCRYAHASATCTYMYLIRNEFPGLNDKYPVERFFDDMFVAETRQTRLLDTVFWGYSLDTQRKGANVAAELALEQAKLPFGYDGAKPVYPRAQFWDASSRALGADGAVRSNLLAKLESYYGTTRFDEFAMGRFYFSFPPDVSKPEGRKEFFGKLSAYLDRAEKTPAFVFPPSLAALSALGSPTNLAPAELSTLLRIFTQCAPSAWPGGAGMETLVCMAHEGLVAQKRPTEIFPLIPSFWKIARDTGNLSFSRPLSQYAAGAMEAERFNLAAAYSAVGLDMMGASLPEDVRNVLLAVRSKSLATVGTVLPVERADRRYPIFASQAAYLTAKIDNAWELYLSNRGLALTEFKNLDPSYTIWLVEKLTETGNYDDADALAQKMIEWVDAAPQGFEPETRAHLMNAFADIAFAREEYPRARAQYERVAVAKEFDGTMAKRVAELKTAEVDRLTRNYERAIDQLEKLAHRKDAYLQAEGNYQLALIKFDQEEYPESRAFLDEVFAVDMHHANARILEGKLYLKLRKLIEATEVKVGLSSSQQTIVPGKPLKVELEDRNLAVVGKAAEIEVCVRTTSGDEEFFALLPFGDSKTKFEGQLPTELGAAKKNDHILQLLGGDTVRYDFSDRFKTANKIAAAEPTSISIASDAELFISSGKILSREELEQRALERLIRTRIILEGAASAGVALSTVRAEDEVKPGAMVNVRIVDPDESLTAGKDKLKVRVATTSGDRIDGFVLEEMDNFSGVFEGRIPTASASATAYASDAEEGKEPNYAISSGNYPGWVGLADGRRPKLFSVDLNRSTELGKLTILADVPGRRLKQFVLQTSGNGKNFVSAGAWPIQIAEWDGTPRLELVRYAEKNSLPASTNEFADYLAVGHMAQGAKKALQAPAPMAISWDATVGGYADAMGLTSDGVNSWYIGHLQTAFFLTNRQVRTFRIDHKNRLNKIRYFLTVDGVGGKTAYEVTRSFGRGVHRVDLYLAAQRNANPAFELQCDIPEPPYMAVCPAKMFDPAEHPEIRQAAFRPAEIKPDSGSNSFEVVFGSNTQARVLRVWLIDFETDAPAIKKLTLTTAAGQTVLPPKQDVATLKQNQTLEIIPGDRISVTYEDPKFVTKEKRLLEASMTATFHNAEVSACFVESSVEAQGLRRPSYIPMRRFKINDTVNVFVNDPDGDTSDAPDKVTFTARATDGKPVELDALETEAHSGIFIGKVFPVEGPPQRPSEVTVGRGDDLIIGYQDAENTDPGIPWARLYVLEQTTDVVPDVRVYDVASRSLTDDEMKTLARGTDSRRLEEYVPVIRTIAETRPMDRSSAKMATNLIGCPLIVELTYPTIVQSPKSKASIYVQTSSGRKKLGRPQEGEFDIKVPGTIRLDRLPGDITTVDPPPGYREVLIRGNPQARNALEDGRFTFLVPMKLGPVPDESLAFEEEDDAAAKDDDSRREYYVSVAYVDAQGELRWSAQRMRLPTLSVRGDDEIFVGFQYKAGTNATQWVTRRVALTSDPFFDVMENRYEYPIEALHVGESAYLRVIDPSRDLSDEKDAVEVDVSVSSGKRQPIRLTETLAHSGIFKGVERVEFAGDPGRTNEMGSLMAQYGDTVACVYRKPGDTNGIRRAFLVYKGADGKVLPFTKRFREGEIAVQTQFTMAESYFEIAKKHRELKQDDLARREIAQGKKLLEEAIHDYPNTEARAQADYLLANLSLEFANDAPDDAAKKTYYMEAVTRFSDIVASYPNSLYAPKAQYKKALVFEKMGQIDQACEEYVKLSYRYPDNDLVAETIARLGQYFSTKGRELQEKAKAEANVVEQEKINLRAKDMYRTAGQVFGRLAQRFPDHSLAWKTTVLSAQSYVRAEDYPKAIEVFKQVVQEKKADNDLLAQSMYWCGDCYMKQMDYLNAYRMFKKLTWDYPESSWAKYARARLTEDALARVEEQDATGQN